jgi:hypothetical protein
VKDPLTLIRTMVRDLASGQLDANVCALADVLQDHPEHIAQVIRWMYAMPLDGLAPDDERFARTQYVVEATSYEYMCLWRENRNDFPESMPWDEDGLGKSVFIGTVGGHPVILECRWATINGRLIMFWNSPSMVTHFGIISGWLKMYCNPFTSDNREARCNAMNFHQCLDFCRET